MLPRRLASELRASRIWCCSSKLRVPSPSSYVQILKRLTPANRANRLCDRPSVIRSLCMVPATVVGIIKHDGCTSERWS
jgi:hypothetical protein